MIPKIEAGWGRGEGYPGTAQERAIQCSPQPRPAEILYGRVILSGLTN